MSKILAVLLLAFGLVLAENNATDQNDTSIISIVNQIQTINEQIKILEMQKEDANSTLSVSNLTTLQARKAKLLDRIPFSIMQIEVKQSDLDKFNAQKASLEKRVARLEKLSDKNQYVQSAIELERMKMNEAFFTTIINLEEMFKEGAKNGSIKELIDDGLLALQTTSYIAIKELKDGLGEGASAHNEAFYEITLKKQTFEEVLGYLKKNADLLSSNLIVSELNLRTAIDYINDKVGLKSDKFNVGKIVISLAIFAFFVSLTRILVKFSYWLFLSFFTKNIHAEAIKEQVLEVIKKPISALLIIYSISICASVWYYPVPTPINLANFFIIAYIVAFGWLILTLLNGYGMLIIGEIAKKSGRKEVVNLVLKITYFIVIVITFLMVLSRLGFDISAIVASLGIGGLAVAFAAKDIIANFFASVMLLFDNSFSQGDWIVCGDIEGTVVEIGLRKTTIRSFDNALIFVPNSKLAGDPICNWTRRKVGRNIKMTIGLTYDSSPEALLKCINDIRQMLLSHPQISKSDNGGTFAAKDSLSRYRQNIVSIDDLAGYKSVLRVSLAALSDSSIDIAIDCFTKTTLGDEYVMVKQDIIFKIMQIVASNGLNFAFPSQSLYVESGEEPKFIKQNPKEELI